MKVEVTADEHLTVKVLTPNLMCLQSFEALLKLFLCSGMSFSFFLPKQLRIGFKKNLHLYLTSSL